MTPNWPPTLTLETEPVLNLFTGENFYSSADAAIREVILNAIDAIGRRNDTEPDIEQSIEIVFNSKTNVITISDNGVGMDQSDLASLFTKTGASAAGLTHGTNDYRAVGEFGIGALSYFLLCDEYRIETKKNGFEPIGLVFSNAMLNGMIPAGLLETTRVSTGTTVTLLVKTPELFNMAIEKFSHWMRNVNGLSATLQPDNKIIEQGGLTRQVRVVSTPTLPDWIEETNIGPPENLDIWDTYDGRGQVDILYRGVFVERVELDQLWGLEGAIHVDPKYFRPKLNREGFVGDALKNEVTSFLKLIHPLVLKEALECIRDLLQSRDKWSLNKAITLWLAVPRSQGYKDAAKVWDEEFFNRKAIRLLGMTSEREVSVAELKQLNANEIYLAPDQINDQDPVIGQAIRVLRAKKAVVVQGLHRDASYLSTISINSQYTSWLLLNTFRTELPVLKEVQSVAQSIVGEECIAEVFTNSPLVKLVHLGNDSSPFIAIREEIWINTEADEGKKIIEEICQRNEGHLGLWTACMMHAPEQGQRLNEIGVLLRKVKPEIQRLGLVRRQYLMSLLK